MKIFHLSVAIFILSLLLFAQCVGQAPIGGGPLPDIAPGSTLDVYVRALRELGAFGALLYLMVMHQRERREFLNNLDKTLRDNTEAILSLQQFMRDRQS